MLFFLTASLYGFKNEHCNPADYAVENCGDDFYIHRVVPITERFFYSRDQLIITSEGKYLLPNIGRGETFEEAQKIVISFWKTVTKGSRRSGHYSKG